MKETLALGCYNKGQMLMAKQIKSINDLDNPNL